MNYPMNNARNIVLTGATGLVGAALKRRLEAEGFRVVALGRRRDADTFLWDAEKGEAPPAESLKNLKAVVNLAGPPIAVRWTRRRKEAIRSARVRGTLALAEALAALPESARPEVFVSMSGSSVYGVRREESRLTENSLVAGDDAGFLTEVAKSWEAATDPASQAGIRTVLLRTGMVLSPKGGALRKLLPLFRLGLGGPIGDGRQRVAWISLDDLVSLILFAIRTPEIAGPLDAVAPDVVSNAEFGRELGRALHKPAVLPTPAFALKLAFGRMAVETVLSDIAPYPEKALNHHFRFAHPRLRDALVSMDLR